MNTEIQWERSKHGAVTIYSATINGHRVTIRPTGARRGLGLDWRATTNVGAAAVTLGSASTLRDCQQYAAAWLARKGLA